MIRNWILKTADFIAGPAACWSVAMLALLRGKAKVPEGWAPPHDPRHILVIRPGGLGDMILLIPSLEALAKAFPSAEIDIICESRNMGVVELSGIRANCLPYDTRPLEILHHLSTRRYSIAIDSEQFHMFSAVFAGLSGAEARIGFNINPRRNGIYTHLIPYDPDAFEGEEFLKLLKPAGISSTGFQPACLRQQAGAEPAAGRLLQQLKDFRDNRKIVAVHAGGSARRKLWPEESMAGLIASLLDRGGIRILLLGTRKDRNRIDGIMGKRAFRPEDILSFTEQTSISGCAALISNADLFVGPDSGLMHLAAACRTPCVAIFGPSDHNKWGYISNSGRVVRSDTPCAPCFIFGYSKPCRDYQCIQNVKVEDVLRACIEAGDL